jgi:subtilase family serine protease
VLSVSKQSEPLAAGESRQEGVRLSDAACTPPVAVTVEADSTKLVEDSDRGNNTMTDVLRPDLRIAAVEPPRTPASAAVVSPTCTITYTIRNAGKADAPRSTTRVSASPGGSADRQSAQLYAGDARTEQASVTCATRASPAATPAIMVTANVDGKVDESDRGNNTATYP